MGYCDSSILWYYMNMKDNKTETRVETLERTLDRIRHLLLFAIEEDMVDDDVAEQCVDIIDDEIPR